MDIFQAIVLGLIQGLTEFIPVSSSGHIFLIPYLFGWNEPSIIFDLALHTGTLLALIFYFRRKLWNLAKTILKLIKKVEVESKEKQKLNIYRNVLVATIPAAIIGYLLRDVISSIYKTDDANVLKLSVIYTSSALIIVGIVFLLSDWLIRKKYIELSKLGYIGALAIGLAQAVALFRGVSRSGITLLTGQVFGLKRVDAAEFSFLMSIPIMIITTGYGIYELTKLDGAELSSELTAVLIGILTAAISGYFAINYMLKYLKKNGLWQFGIYRIMLGVFVLIIVL